MAPIQKKKLKRYWADSKAKEVCLMIEDHYVHIAPWRKSGATLSISAVEHVRNAIAEGRAEVYREIAEYLEDSIGFADRTKFKDLRGHLKAMLKDVVNMADEG